MLRKFQILSLLFVFVSSQAYAMRCLRAVRGEVYRTELREVSRLLLEPKALEERAYRLLEIVAAKRERHVEDTLSWLTSLRESQLEKPLSVLEHAALTYVFHSRIFESHSNTQAQTLVREGLTQSWETLTGRSFPKSGQLPRLPHSVLRKASPEARIFERAAFELNNRPKQLRVDLREGVADHIKERMIRWADRVPLTFASVLTTMLTLALAFHHLGREIIAGTLVGLAGASLNEYLIHIGVGHAPEGIKRAFRRFGIAGKFAEEITLAHQVHHVKISRDFGDSFKSESERLKVDRILVLKARELVMSREEFASKSRREIDAEAERVAASIRTGNYGVDGTTKGAIGMYITATPMIFFNTLVAATMGSQAFFASSMLSLFGFITQSLYSHRYLHMRPHEIAAVETSWKDASTWLDISLKWYMTTPIAWLQQRLHFTHHKSEWDYEKTSNGVIMAFSVADYMVRGGVENPSVKHLLELREQGFLDYTAAAAPNIRLKSLEN